MIRKLGILTLLAMLLAIPAAQASPGALDTSFGAGGLAVSNQEISNNLELGFTLLPNGDTAILGTLLGEETTDPDVGKLARFNASGALNSSFWSGGTYDADLGATSAHFGALAAGPDGGLVALGDVVISGQRRLYVQRFDPLAPFANASAFMAVGGLSCRVYGGAVQSDLKFLVATGCSPNPYIARITTNRDFDTDFNGSGYAPASTSEGAFKAVAIQPDGKVVTAGVREMPSGPDRMIVVRYRSNGTFDPDFHDATSGSGRVNISPYGNNNEAYAVAVQPDGKIVVAGRGNEGLPSTLHPSLVRLNSDGSLDGTFGTGGIVKTTDHPGDATYTGVAIQPDGKIIVVGRQTEVSARTSVVKRFNANGTLDASFGSGGAVIGTPVASQSAAVGVAVQPDGKIVVGEFLMIGGAYTTGVLRLQGDDPAGTANTPAKPSTRFKSPSKSKLRAKKFKEISGTAANSTKVEVAVLKTDRSLLKKKKRCSQLSSNRAKFTKVKAVNKKCQPVKWLRATGAASWKFKLKKTLPVASYTIYVRAIGAGGTSTPLKKSLKLTK